MNRKNQEHFSEFKLFPVLLEIYIIVYLSSPKECVAATVRAGVSHGL